MARRMKKKKSKPRSKLFEIKGLVIVAVSLLLGAFYFTEAAGVAGNMIKLLSLGLLGRYIFVIPVLLLVYGIHYLIKKGKIKENENYILILFILLCVSALNHCIIFNGDNEEKIVKTLNNIYLTGKAGQGGGLIGGLIGEPLLGMFGKTGSLIILPTSILIAFLLLTKVSIVSLFNQLFKKLFRKRKKDKTEDITTDIDKEDKRVKDLEFNINNIFYDKEENTQEDPVIFTNEKEENKEAQDKSDELSIKNSEYKEYVFPPITLLRQSKGHANKNKAARIKNNAVKLVEALQSFGVNAKVINIDSGPTVTRYELQPSAGVKVSKIVNLADDIALNLAASDIRIEAPIPGKAAIGIEVPNDRIQSVLLRDVIELEDFRSFPSKLAFALGKDITGKPVIADISRMPHLLIAGATGSGKSVCINSLITSIIYKATPDEVKLVLIDPKVVELGVYNGIPHLLIPVVKDPKKAASSLNWAVSEMVERYNKFADKNVRDIKAYNQLSETDDDIERLPNIVIIIDELSDLMMVAPDDVENSICRLAQMARAAGMHLVIATQRPSVDVITGVIKANIPSRISFAVSSQVDSRTILDMAGAEKLIGKGDMLFCPIGASKPIRIQGAFISDNEVEKITKYIKDNTKVEYEEEVIEKIDNNKEIKRTDTKETDELLPDAVELVVNASQASISMLQRRFRIGYARAARLIDEMEIRGIVGGHEGSKPRQVLITKEQLENIKLSE